MISFAYDAFTEHTGGNTMRTTTLYDCDASGRDDDYMDISDVTRIPVMGADDVLEDADDVDTPDEVTNHGRPAQRQQDAGVERDEEDAGSCDDDDDDTPLDDDSDEAALLAKRLHDTASELSEARDALDAANKRVEGMKHDFDNFKRRADDDADRNKAAMVSDVAKALLPVLDDLERSVKHYETSGSDADASFANGNAGIVKKMLSCLGRLGVEQFDPTGEEFDPNSSMAIRQEHTDGTMPGTVTATYQKGYRFGDVIIRAAQVEVAC